MLNRAFEISNLRFEILEQSRRLPLSGAVFAEVPTGSAFRTDSRMSFFYALIKVECRGLSDSPIEVRSFVRTAIISITYPFEILNVSDSR
jgi:hypothetical protein